MGDITVVHRGKSRIVFGFACALMALSIAISRGEAQKNPTSKPEEDSVARSDSLDAYLAEREKLVRGEYFIDGTITYDGWEFPQTVSLHCWFDFENEVFRYDETMPTGGKDREHPKLTRGVLVMRPDFYVSWNEAKTNITIDPNKKVSPFAEFWTPDMRVPGLVRPTLYVANVAWASTKASLDGRRLISAVASLDGKTVKEAYLTDSKLDRLGRESGLGFEMWFDRGKQTTLSKSLIFSWANDAVGQEDQERRKPVATIQIDWLEKNGMSVPNRLRMSETVYQVAKLKREYDLQFCWQSVNGEAALTNYDVKNLGLDGRPYTITTGKVPELHRTAAAAIHEAKSKKAERQTSNAKD